MSYKILINILKEILKKKNINAIYPILCEDGQENGLQYGSTISSFLDILFQWTCNPNRW